MSIFIEVQRYETQVKASNWNEKKEKHYEFKVVLHNGDSSVILQTWGVNERYLTRISKEVTAYAKGVNKVLGRTGLKTRRYKEVEELVKKWKVA